MTSEQCRAVLFTDSGEYRFTHNCIAQRGHAGAHQCDRHHPESGPCAWTLGVLMTDFRECAKHHKHTLECYIT